MTMEEPRRTDQIGSASTEFSPPSPDTIPGSQLDEKIRLGYEIVVNTQEYGRLYHVSRYLRETREKNVMDETDGGSKFEVLGL